MQIDGLNIERGRNINILKNIVTPKCYGIYFPRFSKICEDVCKKEVRIIKKEIKEAQEQEEAE